MRSFCMHKFILSYFTFVCIFVVGFISSSFAQSTTTYGLMRVSTNTKVDHKWPAINNLGDIVWSKQVGGFWQVFKREASGTVRQITSDNRNHKHPVISDDGTIVWFQDNSGPGVGWEVIGCGPNCQPSSTLFTIEFSSRNNFSGQHRDAGMHFGIASNGTTISYFSFCDAFCPSSQCGLLCGISRRFNVSGVGQLAGNFLGYDQPDINNQGLLVYRNSLGRIFQASTISPFTGTDFGVGTFPRIADAPSNEIVYIKGSDVVSTVGGVVAPGVWADVNNDGTIVLEQVLKGVSQIFLAKICEPITPIPAFSWKQTDSSWGNQPYDHSYRSTRKYIASDKVSTSGTLELHAGNQGRFTINLTPAENNVNKLASAIRSINGFNAVARDVGSGNLYLDVYNTGCQNSSCFPRSHYHVDLCENSCSVSPPLSVIAFKGISKVGCLLTSLAMSLKFAGVQDIITTTGPKTIDPFVLNEFMSNTEQLLNPGGTFDDEADVTSDATVARVRQNISNSKSIEFEFRSRDSRTSLSEANEVLDKALCFDKLPVIVGVKRPGSAPGHYILVINKEGKNTDGSQYVIADPGFSKTNLKDWNNDFLTIGVVKDPPDLSSLNIRTSDNADVLVVDESGRSTGFDPLTGTVIDEIPESAYVQMALSDDDTDEPATGVRHIVQIRRPQDSQYTIMVNGVKQGDYTLSIDAYSTDGSIQPALRIPGTVILGAPAIFTLQYDTTPGSQPIIIPTNLPPVADAGLDQVVRLGSVVTLNGSGSFDPDNGPNSLSFTWTQTAGPPVVLQGSTTPAPTFTPIIAGVYEFSLVVSDGLDSSMADIVQITVQLPGDLDGDGDVDCADLAIVKASFGKKSGQPGFDLRADTNSDGVVNVRDLSFVAHKLPAGTRCP